MVQFNLALREINCKIVYFGPGLSGKTTNLEVVHEKAPPDSKGNLTSIATESDRTLFFDFMPLNLGTVGGMRTKFQLYTVPGQVYYNSTRKLVLRGADGVIFVADSAPDKMQENLESFQNLEECLSEQDKDLKSFPHVIQWNKRDLEGALPVEELAARLNPYGVQSFEAVASEGQGVIETFKALSSLVLEKVKAMAERSGTTGAPTPLPQKAGPETKDPSLDGQEAHQDAARKGSADGGQMNRGQGPPHGADLEPGGIAVLSGSSARGPLVSKQAVVPALNPASAVADLVTPPSSAVSAGSSYHALETTPLAVDTGSQRSLSSISSAYCPGPLSSTSGRVMVSTSRHKRPGGGARGAYIWLALGAALFGALAYAWLEGLL